MRRSLLIVGAVLFPLIGMANEREERPAQIQYLLLNGISAGYHLNDTFFLGVSYFTPMELTLEGSNDKPSALYGQDYVDEFQSETEQSRALELRISPFDGGFYFSVAGLTSGKQKQTVTYEQRNRVLPDDAATQLSDTSMTITVEVEEWSGAAIGLGYTAIWDSGFSLSFGLLFSPVVLEPEVTVDFTPDAYDTDANQQAMIDRVEDDFGTSSPGLGFIGLGYNF
jgi:hypothetical protein